MENNYCNNVDLLSRHLPNIPAMLTLLFNKFVVFT